MGTQPSDDALLAGVANRISAREGLQDEIEPDRRAPGSDVLDRRMAKQASLETEELLMRGARRCSDGTQAEAGADTGSARLAPEEPEGFAGSAPTAIRRALSRAHGRIVADRDLPRLT
jgi:hypothetical protein